MFSASSVAEGTGLGTEMEAMEAGATPASPGRAWVGEVDEEKVEGRDVLDTLQAAAPATHGTRLETPKAPPPRMSCANFSWCVFPDVVDDDVVSIHF